jgi:hypothetical protein
LLVEREQIKSLYPSRSSFVLDGGAERGTNTLTTKTCADKYAPKPWSEIFAPLKIMHAKGGSSERFVIRMRNPCDRQLISIQVRL